LLALSEGATYAYALNDRLLADSMGSLMLRPSSLSRLLRELERRNLVQRLNNVSDYSEGPARIIYGLTDFGRRFLRDEAGTWARAATLARVRLG
jgi:DNA-binding PadR family transcriptional regulator